MSGAEPDVPLAGVDADARLARLRSLLAEREPHYLRADIVVDTDALDVAAAGAAVDAALAEAEGEGR